MEAAPRLREPGGLGAPAILIDAQPSSRFRGSDRSPPFSIYSSSVAMSIPGTDSRIDAPPPLPPPRYISEQQHYHPRDSERDFDHGLVVGSIDEQPNYKRHPRPDRDEGYASLSSMSSARSQYSLPSIKTTGVWDLHQRYQFPSSADAFVDMKKKLDPLKTFDNKSPSARSLLSASSSATSDFSSRSSRDTRFSSLSLSAALPFHTKAAVLNSPDRYTHTPLQSAVSPRAGPFSLGTHPDYRSPISTIESDRSPPHRTRRTNSGSLPDDATVSTQGSSYDGDEMDLDEAPSIRDERAEAQAAGSKRRATSPLGDEPCFHGLPSHSSLLRRRDGGCRGSPTPRLTTIPQGSVSSVSTARTGSFTSNLSLITGGSITSAGSFGRRSPGGHSADMSPITTDPGCASPFGTPMSLAPSPRTNLSRHTHQRNTSDTRQMASPRGNKPGGAKMQGFFMCECCPKKPKKFETKDELSAHEAEKQYECSFCGNRFKNKNEAERHQNSLHVRRHSWSCSALIGYDRAFHESTNRPGEADACGYCGDEFPRSGINSKIGAPEASNQDWEERIQHLQDVHKFQECNSSKKFFRADHFRQHLKHSHAGTSGKWTNMLENACMLDEEPPISR